MLRPAQYWIQIMKDVQYDSWSRAYTMFDILNEPDSYGLTWPVVGPLYHQVMTAGYKINPCARRLIIAFCTLLHLYCALLAPDQAARARPVPGLVRCVLTVAVSRRRTVFRGGHGSGQPGQQLGRR